MSEDRFKKVLNKLGIQYLEDVNFDDLFQCDFLIPQNDKGIIVEVIGSYHLNFRALSGTDMKERPTLYHEFYTGAHHEEFLDAKTELKLNYMTTAGYKVIMIDSKKLYLLSEDEFISEFNQLMINQYH